MIDQKTNRHSGKKRNQNSGNHPLRFPGLFSYGKTSGGAWKMDQRKQHRTNRRFYGPAMKNKNLMKLYQVSHFI